MKLYSTIWRMPLWAWVPVALAIVAEATSNSLRAYGLGSHLDRFTMAIHGHDVSLAGAVLVCAAIAVSLSQTRAAWVALTPGTLRQRIVSGLAGALLLAVSVTAMASHVLEAQRSKVADEGSDRGRYDRTLAAYNKAASELSGIGAVRTMEDVKAAMEAAPIPRGIFVRTKECTEVTRDDSFEACKYILELRQDMAKAIRKRQLESEVPRLKAELDRQTRPKEASASEDAVAGVWPWLMGLGVVFIATFGAVIYAKVEMVATRQETVSERFPARLPPKIALATVSEQSVIDALRRAGRPVSNNELAELMGVTKGESSKRVSALNGKVRKVSQGREVAISLVN